MSFGASSRSPDKARTDKDEERRMKDGASLKASSKHAHARKPFLEQCGEGLVQAFTRCWGSVFLPCYLNSGQTKLEQACSILAITYVCVRA